MYQERMLDYYPPVIQSIEEFKAIIGSESPEFELLAKARDEVLDNAYLTTMGEERIAQWERILNIRPVENSTVEDRRDTIIARIRGQGKLNTALINTIVKTFTGGEANSWIENDTLCVEITPPPESKSYIFANVEQELAKKVPAHLRLNVFRNYGTWGEIQNRYPKWSDVQSNFNNWEDVLLFIPPETEA